MTQTEPVKDVSLWPDGTPRREQWILDGVVHREDGPAEVNFRPNGRPNIELYYRHGKVHRVDGPSGSAYGRDGDLLTQEWCLDGVEYYSHDEYYAAIAAWTPERIRDEFEQSSYAELLDEGADPYAIVEGLRGGVRTIEGLREVVRGAPIEWVRSFEDSHHDDPDQ